MEKEQSKLKVLSEIRKQRVNGFPYFIVAATYSSQDHHFIVAADYRGETAELSIYPFKNDMNRLATSTIILNDILTRKLIATIHVSSIVFKPNPSSVTITQAEFILGFRTGQLIVVEYKDRECKVKQRFNKVLKGEGFLSRASSAIFGGEDSYNPYFKAPIRSFTLNPFSPDFYHIWQVGNNIMLQRQLNQDKENKFFSKHQSMDLQNYHLNYDINKVIKEGDYYLYGCDYYTVLCHLEYKIFLISFKQEINSFTNLPGRKELVVSLSSKEEILILDYNFFMLKAVMRLDIPLRNLTSFISENQVFLILMPYENYIIIYNLNNHTYCKLKGHKSYIANVCFNQKDGRIITAGMDHRICFLKIRNVLPRSWIAAEKTSQSDIKIKEFDIPDQKFDDIYHIGEYNNNRTNLSSYGYAHLFELNDSYCFSTYDSKIFIYAPF